MRDMNQRALPIAASASYLANCALGASVATGVISTRKVRWVHHGLFVVTATLTAAAATAAVAQRRADRAALLIGALAVLGAAPFVDTHTWRHGATASAAAPFFLAALNTTRSDHGVS